MKRQAPFQQVKTPCAAAVMDVWLLSLESSN